MPYSARFEEAFLYAHRLHADQTRKGTPIPYISHLMSVAALVAEHGGGEDQVLAALLHDVVEDQGGAPRLAEIRQKFGDTVALIVHGCTDADEIPKPPWRQRKEAYIAHLADAPAEVLLVSAADKLHNARTIVADLRQHGPACFGKFKGGQDGTLWYYRSLVAAFRQRGSTLLVEELARVVEQMHQLAGI